jgi:hypothetical protein
MIHIINAFTYILFLSELVSSKSFHIHIWAIKYHIINQQNIRYHGITICFAIQKEFSHNIIFHLRNNIHTITVRNKNIHFMTSKNTYMWLFYFLKLFFFNLFYNFFHKIYCISVYFISISCIVCFVFVYNIFNLSCASSF